MKIIFERYLEAAQLLELQAKPYSPICSAYISYSRGYFSATVNETQKKITFLDNPENRSIVISDMVESILRDQSTGLKFPPVQDLSLANSKLSFKMDAFHIVPMKAYGILFMFYVTQI